MLRDGNLANIYNGLENSVQTVLPIGDASSNYEIDITAMISDQFGYATNKVLKVTVSICCFVDGSILNTV